MRRKVSYGGAFGLGKVTKHEIIIDKDGMRVENEDGWEDKNLVIGSVVRAAVDSGHWQHSWHMDVSNARWRHCKERKKVRGIIKKQIAAAEAQVKFLKEALQILSRWH